MCQASPRLHDGRIVRVLACEPPTLRVAFDTYKRFAVGAVVPTGVLALGISGVVTRRRDGREEILLGRRSPQTRIYGDLWETAPRGGVDASSAATELTLADIIRQFHEELHEETGIVATATPRPVAVVLDEFARTYDVVLRVEVSTDTEAHPHEWEYTQTVWKTLAEARETDTLSPPTRSLIDWLAATALT
ncbi:MAG: NUDIX domain-containing protein [Phycisphaerales bacterium]|nr:NUDIX domain-containing protein [Phycisphaerales bacterium]